MLPWPKRRALWSQLTAAFMAAPAPEALRDERLLLGLGEELPRFEEEDELLAYVLKQLGRHLDALSCGCVEHDQRAGTYRVVAEHRQGGTAYSGEHSLSGFPSELSQELQRGSVLSIADIKGDPRTRDGYASRCTPYGTHAMLVVPVLRDHTWVATLYLTAGQVRFWTTVEQQLAQTVAERAWLWVDRIRMLRALRASERKYRQLIENTSEGVWEIDAQGNTRFVNARMTLLLGYSEQEMQGTAFTRYMDEAGRNEALQLVERRRSGVAEAHDFRFVRRDGSTLWARVEASPVFDAAGGYHGALAMLSDISERKQAEADQLFLLGLSEVFATANEPAQVYTQVVSRLGAHLGSDRCMIARIDAEQELAVVEDEWHSAELAPLHGKHRLVEYGGVIPSLMQGRAAAVHDCSADAQTQQHAAAFLALGLRAFAAVPMRQDGRAVALLVLGSARPCTWTPRALGLAGVLADRAASCVQRLENIAALRDMSRELERRVEARTAQLKGLLAEKEVLLKEVHHRVKNNLQVISSLLNLQSMRIEDPAAAAVLAESRGRVHSIALVHEILYASRDLSGLDFAAYVRALVQMVLQAHAVPGCYVTSEVDADSAYLPLALAIPCGLLINELLTNSLKHAFVGRRQGCISVRLTQAPDGRVQLEVADDGVGLPEHEDEPELRSLGLDLVHTFAEQLDADIQVERNHGTRFRLLFNAALVPIEPARGS